MDFVTFPILLFNVNLFIPDSIAVCTKLIISCCDTDYGLNNQNSICAAHSCSTFFFFFAKMDLQRQTTWLIKSFSLYKIVWRSFIFNTNLITSISKYEHFPREKNKWLTELMDDYANKISFFFLRYLIRTRFCFLVFLCCNWTTMREKKRILCLLKVNYLLTGT